ncbi:hypothetical protein D3C72_658580 [compost metagenome]
MRAKVEADTHPKSGNTTTPPNPPREFDDGGFEQSVHLAPHADGAGGESDPQHPRTTAQELSEERHEHENVGGNGLLAEGGSGSAVEWRDDLAWPVNMREVDRRYLRECLQPLGQTLGQRVLDEWRGCIKAGGVADEWAYFHALLRKAQEQGEAWQTDHAEKISHAREQAKRTVQLQKQVDQAYAASLQTKADVVVAPGRGGLLKQFRESGYLRGAAAKGAGR